MADVARSPGRFQDVLVILTLDDSVIASIPLPVRRITLNRAKTGFTIGRASKSSSRGIAASRENGLFDSPIMSREHAQIFADLEQEKISVRDLGSTHGTFVNNEAEPLKKNENRELKDGDKVRFGVSVFKGSEVFAPTTVSVGIMYKNSTTQPEPSKQGSSTFAVPDDDESDMDSASDDSIRHFVKAAPKVTWKSGGPNNQEGPIDLTAFSDEDESDDGSMMESTSRPLATSPFIHGSSAPQATAHNDDVEDNEELRELHVDADDDVVAYDDNADDDDIDLDADFDTDVDAHVDTDADADDDIDHEVVSPSKALDSNVDTGARQHTEIVFDSDNNYDEQSDNLSAQAHDWSAEESAEEDEMDFDTEDEAEEQFAAEETQFPANDQSAVGGSYRKLEAMEFDVGLDGSHGLVLDTPNEAWGNLFEPTFSDGPGWVKVHTGHPVPTAPAPAGMANIRIPQLLNAVQDTSVNPVDMGAPVNPVDMGAHRISYVNEGSSWSYDMGRKTGKVDYFAARQENKANVSRFPQTAVKPMPIMEPCAQVVHPAVDPLEQVVHPAVDPLEMLFPAQRVTPVSPARIVPPTLELDTAVKAQRRTRVEISDLVDNIQHGSKPLKRKAEDISEVAEQEMSWAQEQAELEIVPVHAVDMEEELVQGDGPADQRRTISGIAPAVTTTTMTMATSADQSRLPKRLRLMRPGFMQVAERAAYAALGGVTVGAMVVGSLIYTAPSFA